MRMSQGEIIKILLSNTENRAIQKDLKKVRELLSITDSNPVTIWTMDAVGYAAQNKVTVICYP